MAIKGLFKKGGVVEKTRDRFIHEASALLEEQVLTAEVLKERLSLEAVERALDELLRDFFLVQLPEVLGGRQLGEVVDQQTAQRLTADLAALWQREQGRIAELVGAQLALDEWLPPEQKERLLAKCDELLQALWREGRFGERFLQCWLDNAGALTGEQLGLAELAQELAAQLGRLSRTLLAELAADWGQELAELLAEVIKRLDVRGLLHALEWAFRERPVREFLVLSPQELAERCQRFLAEDEGRRLCGQLSGRLLALAGQMEQPVGELLGEEVRSLLRPFVAKQLPLLVESVIVYLRENEQAFHELIEEAIDETAAEAGSMKGLALQLVKDSVLQGIFAEHTIINKSAEFLHASMSAEEMTEQVTQLLLAAGQGMSAADLIRLLGGEQGPLKPMIAELIRGSAWRFAQDGLAERLALWLDKPLGAYLPEDLAGRYGKTVEEALVRYLLAQLADCLLYTSRCV